MEMSSSPDRGTFQRQAYIERCEADGVLPAEHMMDMFDKILEDRRKQRFEPKEDDLETDLRTTEWILEKVRSSEVYAQNLYAAMCNNEFIKQEVIPILSEQKWSCSWRYAGGIIADMRQQGDYIDWYCSGIRNSADLDDESYLALSKAEQEAYLIQKRFVSESHVTDEIYDDLMKLGWKTIEDDGSRGT